MVAMVEERTLAVGSKVTEATAGLCRSIPLGAAVYFFASGVFDRKGAPLRSLLSSAPCCAFFFFFF